MNENSDIVATEVKHAENLASSNSTTPDQPDSKDKPTLDELQQDLNTLLLKTIGEYATTIIEQFKV